MLCIYHSADFDGICSAAIVRHKFPECELIPWDNGFPIPDFDGRTQGETVYMVDISFPIQVMINLSFEFYLIVIDHHDTFRQEVTERRSEFCKGTRFVFPPFKNGNKSGCELTWDYLFPENYMPTAVKLLGRYDVKDLESPNVMAFQYGLRAFASSYDPEIGVWSDLLTYSDIWGAIRDHGLSVVDFVHKDYLKYLEDFSFEASDDAGHRFLCLNRGNVDSTFAKNGELDTVLGFVWRPALKKWRFYLYSTKPDFHCGEYAKQYGGGGHAQAAGFHMDELPGWLRKGMEG